MSDAVAASPGAVATGPFTISNLSHYYAALEAERALHRPFSSPCELPNAVSAQPMGTAGGCSGVAHSRDGRWLAAACGSAEGVFKVAVYHGLTGQLQAVLGTHDGLVYGINWSADDSAIVTASADLTAKVWHLRQSPLGGIGAGSLAALESTTTTLRSGAGIYPWSASEEAQGLEAAAAIGEAPEDTEQQDGDTSATTTLQHACFVYCAAFCPLPGLGSAVVVTGGYDGVLRVWEATSQDHHGGLLLHSAPVSSMVAAVSVGWDHTRQALSSYCT